MCVVVPFDHHLFHLCTVPMTLDSEPSSPHLMDRVAAVIPHTVGPSPTRLDGKMVPSFPCLQITTFNSSSFPPSATPSIRELISIHVSVSHLNMIQSVGTRYPTLGIFLLEDDNGVLVDALTLEHQRNAEEITHAIFKRWIGGTGRRPTTWRTLVGVLRQSQLATQADAIETYLNR